MGREMLKFHDSAVEFELGVWFTIHPKRLMLKMDVVAHLHTKTCTWVNRHKSTHTHSLCNAPHTGTHPPSFFSKWFICSDSGEMIPCNETDREDDFFIHLGTKQAVALLFMVDSLYKHRQWVWSFPITPSHPHHPRSGFSTLGQTVHLMMACKFIAQRLGEPCRESFCHHPLFNQFTGHELRA